MVPSMDILCGDLSGSLCNARRGCELQYTCTGGMSVPVAFQPVLVFYLLSPPVFVFSCSEQIDGCLGPVGTPKNTDCTDCGFLRNPIHQYLGRLLRNQSRLQFDLVFCFIFDWGVHSEISTAPAGSSGTGLRGSECGTLRASQCYNSMESGHRFRTSNLD